MTTRIHPKLDNRIFGPLFAGAASLAASVLVLSDHRGGDIESRRVHSAVHAQATAIGDARASARPATIVKEVACEKLPNVPGKSITTAVVTFPPSAYSPRHRHPGSVMAFVLQGTLRSQLEGGPVGTYTVGETWFEPPGAIHLFAENASTTEAAQLLATFVTDDDCGPLTIPDQS